VSLGLVGSAASIVTGCAEDGIDSRARSILRVGPKMRVGIERLGGAGVTKTRLPTFTDSP
jgi:hypothetical protein